MRKILAFFLAVTIVLPHVGWAKNSFVYRQRANWVRLVKLSNKQLAGQVLQHPTESITADEMENMLLSLQMNKKSTFKKNIDTLEVFSSFEARRFAGPIVQALAQASPNEVVNVSVIHKRPTFILRNDYVSNINVFVNEEGVHFFFNKLFARLEGDYNAMSNMDEMLKKAKTMRVTLDAKAGQKLSFNNPMHVILEQQHDFAGDVVVEKQKDEAINKEMLKPKKDRKPIASSDDTSEFNDTPVATSSAPKSVSSSGSSSDTASRLRKLEQLHNEKLITDAEYQKKRSEILNAL